MTITKDSLAFNYVMSLLARREYSEFELRCKMQEKSFDEDEIDEVIGYCQGRNWQSDKRFCENYFRFRASRGFGSKRIQQELRQLKGVGDDVIDEVLMELEIDWEQIAENVLRRKFPYHRQDVDFKAKQKIWRYMLSHGFYAEEFEDFIGVDD